jgi:hypothetical protein
MMIQYSFNSPRAMARVIAMMIVTDGHIDDREIAVLDKLDAYTMLGLSRNDFMAVARDYCGELVKEAEQHGGSPAIDADRTDYVIDHIDMREQRLLVARLLLQVIAADKQHRKSERLVFEHILDRWALRLDDIVQ